VKRLERVGLAFGPDTNAYTSFDETVYMLELPETRAEVVDTALLLMREAAGEATLATDAIDRERGVVLSEERTRDTPGLRMIKSQFDFLMKGQLPPKRFPIGDVSVLRTAPRERFVSFYEQYYRPENATFIAVGDFDPAEMESKIRARFSGWRGRGPAGMGPHLGPVAPRKMEGRTFVETGAPAQLTIAWMSKPELDPDTRAERREDWIESLGLVVLNRRLERISRGDDPPFVAASAGHGTTVGAADETSVSADYEPGRWKPALEAVEQEIRRIVLYGVSQRELDRVITEARTSLQASVTGQGTRRSADLAGAIASKVNENDVFTAPDEGLAVFEEAVRGLTAEQVNAALKPLFDGEGPLVFVSSPRPIADGVPAVVAAFNGSRQVAVAPSSFQAARGWAYTNFGAPSRVLERREVSDLGVTFVRFENGTRLTIRPSRNRKDEVLVSARAGDGVLDLRRDGSSAFWVAEAAIIEGGLGKLTTEEIEEALATEVYGVGFDIDENSFVLSGGTRPEDLDTQLQVLAAYATDPGWRPEAVERPKVFASNFHDQIEASPDGVLSRDLDRLLRSGDPRFGLPSREVMAATTVDQVRTEIGGPLSREPFEVVITGDVSVEEAIRQTALTFGALPRRTDDAVPSAATRTPFPAGRSHPVRLTHKGRPDQAVAYIAWPTGDFPSNPQEARAVHVLEQVMRLRLREEIRENQGVTYSPETSHEAAWTYPDYGYLAARIDAPPDKLQPFFADAEKIAKGLRDAPITADELRRAVQPRVQSTQSAQAGNEYWLAQLAGAQTDPRRLNVIRDSITGLQEVTPADVRRVALRYLVSAKAYRLVVVPEAPEKRPAAS
jgi:zinc protease